MIMHHVLLDRGQYEEHRYDHPAPEGRHLKGALRTLKELGYQVTLIPAALATPGSAE
ncbi:MAG: hypothetical protein HYV63_28395 [Candidatus Schekmanbacteria bacterium]|nr:hypothetical protein [Candidatus Schekmanbacteria bacterium]